MNPSSTIFKLWLPNYEKKEDDILPAEKEYVCFVMFRNKKVIKKVLQDSKGAKNAVTVAF